MRHTCDVSSRGYGKGGRLLGTLFSRWLRVPRASDPLITLRPQAFVLVFVSPYETAIEDLFLLPPQALVLDVCSPPK